MDKAIIAKRYELKEIGAFLSDKKPSERGAIKAQELGKIILPDKFTYKGYDFKVIEQPCCENGLLKVSIEVSKDGNELLVDNPLFFKNPPIMVPDGTYHKEINTKGDEVEYQNFVENLEIALKEIIIETVRILNK